MKDRAYRKRNALDALLFLAPFLVFYGAFVLLPFALGFWISLHDWELLTGAAGIEPVYIGLANYTRLFMDPYFWSSLWHSVLFTVMVVPIQTTIALSLALLLNNTTRMASGLRSVFFISGVFSVTVVTLVWLAILSPSRGLAGQVATMLGAAPIDFFADPLLALPAVVLVTVWWSIGVPMAMYLAGLQRIPSEIYEAAALDRASRWAQFRYLTLPALRSTTWLVVVLGIISHFQVFGQILLMTGGGPAGKTKVLVQYIYEASFRDWEMGYATAASVVLFGIMSVVSLCQLRLTRQAEMRS